MYGAILGDIIGSPFEFDRGDKTKEFDLFSKGCRFTDDSVMTIAIGEALLAVGTEATGKEIEVAVAANMQDWGRRYPHAGYGGRFRCWLSERNPKPYGSYGNGSAMRVSAAGWLYNSIEKTSGQLIFHRPNEFHNLIAIGNTAPNIVVVSFECDSPCMKFFEKKLLKLSDSERNLMGMLIAEARRCIKTPLDDPYTEKMEKKEDFLFGSQQLIRIYLEQMLIYMIRRNSSPPMTVPVSQFVNLKNNSAVYKRVIAYMEDHIRENITLCDLCHDNMIGRSQLQKIFQEQHQCGAMDFFSRLKIAYARQLIRENQMNFTQISEFLGYSSIHYFSRQFKKISGMTPTEYITSIKALSERERQ